MSSGQSTARHEIRLKKSGQPHQLEPSLRAEVIICSKSCTSGSSWAFHVLPSIMTATSCKSLHTSPLFFQILHRETLLVVRKMTPY